MGHCTVVRDRRHSADSRIAEPRCLFSQDVKHRLKLTGRGIDDAQHLGGGGLLFQGFARLGDEARVLHRDDRLRREVLQQRNLLVRERADFLAVNQDESDNRVIFPQWHQKLGPGAAEIDQRASMRLAVPVGPFVGKIGNVYETLAR